MVKNLPCNTRDSGSIPSQGTKIAHATKQLSQWATTRACSPHTKRSSVPQLSFSSAQFSCSLVSDSLQPHGLQHSRPPCPSPTPRVYSNSCSLSPWCHPTISSSVIPFSSCLQSSQHQGLFKWVSSSHQVAKVLESRVQHQSFQWLFRANFL